MKIPWQILTALLTLGALYLIVAGAKPSTLALPVYFRRFHPEQFSPLTQLVLPLLGAAAIGYPLHELVKPGQPAPFDRYPYNAIPAWASAWDRSWPTPSERHYWITPSRSARATAAARSDTP